MFFDQTSKTNTPIVNANGQSTPNPKVFFIFKVTRLVVATHLVLDRKKLGAMVQLIAER